MLFLNVNVALEKKELWLEEMGLNRLLEDKQDEKEEAEAEINQIAVKKSPKEKKESKLKRKRKLILQKLKVVV